MRPFHLILPLILVTALTVAAADPVGTLTFSQVLTAGPVGDLPPGSRVSEFSGDLVVDQAGNLYTTITRRIYHSFGGSNVEYFLYILKLTPDGDELYSTLLPDPGRATSVTAIAVDSGGNIYLTGQTESDSLQTTPDVFQPQPPPGQNAYVCKLSASGQEFDFCTYIGGSDTDAPFDIDIDETGAIYVAGYTKSEDFPTTPGSYSPRPPESNRLSDFNGFVTKLSADGSQLLYSTYLGGSEYDRVDALDVDDTGAVFIAGSGGSHDFPVTPGAFRTEPTRIFAVKLSADGSTLLYSTFLGAGGVSAVVADTDGSLWLTGYVEGDNTGPDDFPTTPNAAGSWGQGATDAFVAKLDLTGGRLLYSSFFGGFTSEEVSGLTLDRDANLHVTGFTAASTFPHTSDAEQSCLHGALISGDAFYLKLDSDGRLLYSTFLGGLSADRTTGIGAGPDGAVYLVGDTNSPDFPGTSEPIEFDESGGNRHFLARVEPADPPVSISCVANAASQLNEPATPGGMLTFYGHGLENAEVLFDGIPAPILYSSEGQLNLVTPFGIRGRELVKAEVITPAGPVRPMYFVVRDVAPALFTIDGSGNGHVAAINQDGTINSPSNPAPRGSIVAIYATGLGPLNPPPADGEIVGVDPLPLVERSFRVGFYAHPIYGEITSAGAAPGLIAGAYQVNVRIPDETPSGPGIPVWFWFTEDRTFSLAIRIAIE